jgi:hypothetical protein
LPSFEDLPRSDIDCQSSHNAVYPQALCCSSRCLGRRWKGYPWPSGPP